MLNLTSLVMHYIIMPSSLERRNRGRKQESQIFLCHEKNQ